MGGTRVHVAVLAISDPSVGARVETENAVADLLTEAGHEIAAFTAAPDQETKIRSELHGWIEDPDVDVVLIIGDTRAITRALTSLGDQPLPDLTERLRAAAFDPVAGAPMVSAARCGTTYVFVLPTGERAVRATMQRVILPQLGTDVSTGADAKLENVPTEIPTERTASGAGLAPKLPAKPAPRPRSRTGANVILRQTEDPTKEIDLARLEHQVALSKDGDVTRKLDVLRLEREAAEPVGTAAPSPGPSPVTQPDRARPRSTSRPPAAPSPGPSPVTQRARPRPTSRPPAAPSPAQGAKAPSTPAPAPVATAAPQRPKAPSAPPPAPAARAASQRPKAPSAPPPTVEVAEDLVPLSESSLIEVVEASPSPTRVAEPDRAVLPATLPDDLPAPRTSNVFDVSADAAALPAKLTPSRKPIVIAVAAAALIATVAVVVLTRGSDTPSSTTARASSGVAPASAVREQAPAATAVDEAPPDAMVVATKDPAVDVPPEPRLATKKPRVPAKEPGRGSEPTTSVAATTPMPTPAPPPKPIDPETPVEPPPADVPRLKPIVEPYQPSVGITQSLGRRQIRDAIAKIKPAVIACGEKFKTTGIVKLAISVAPEGNVTNVSVDAAPDEQLGSCVERVLRKARFPITIEGGSFSYPFAF